MSKKYNTFWGHDELPITSFLENSFLFLVWLLVKETLYLGGESIYDYGKTTKILPRAEFLNVDINQQLKHFLKGQ